MTYKGTLKELSSLESLEYSYETSAGGGSGSTEFDEPPTSLTFKGGWSAGNGAKVNKDEVIQVIVKWNGDEETLELYNESD